MPSFSLLHFNAYWLTVKYVVNTRTDGLKIFFVKILSSVLSYIFDTQLD